VQAAEGKVEGEAKLQSIVPVKLLLLSCMLCCVHGCVCCCDRTAVAAVSSFGVVVVVVDLWSLQVHRCFIITPIPSPFHGPIVVDVLSHRGEII
jgi:hypothetical protein